MFADDPEASYEYEIDELDGQRVKTFFQDNFYPHNNIEIRPKLRSLRGQFKGKFFIHPTLQKEKFVVTEEIEIKNTFREEESIFKIKENDIQAYFDLGFRHAGDHLLNPYYSFSLPRSGGIFAGPYQLSGGFLFHHKRTLTSKMRVHLETSLRSSIKKEGSLPSLDMGLKLNAIYAWRNFLFGIYHGVDFTEGMKRYSKASLAWKYQDIFGNIHVQGENASIDRAFLAMAWRVTPTFCLYSNLSRSFKEGEKDTTTPALGLGAEIGNLGGENSAKFSYKTFGRRLGMSMSYGLGKHVTCILIMEKAGAFDSTRREKDRLSWGIRLKINA